MTVSGNSLQSVDDQLPKPHVALLDIKPLPKPSQNKTNRKRKCQRAEVLTSSPFKNIQVEKEAKKKRVNSKAAAKKRIWKIILLQSTGKTRNQRVSKKKMRKRIFVLFVVDPIKTHL